MKPVVKYRAVPTYAIKVGGRGVVIPIDHPNLDVNNDVAFTSRIVSIELNGDFETLNTKYVRVD
jgi:hypothetical protein